MKESHRHYEFGTFDERLEHLCLLLEVDPPEMVYEDGEPILTEPLLKWVTANAIDSNWLFGGSPCVMLREWTKSRQQTREVMKITKQFEPEVQTGMLALLRAVVVHDVPLEEAWPLFCQVMEEFRQDPVETQEAVNA